MPPQTHKRPLTVVVVEHNKTQRSMLRRVLEAEGDIQVVGVADNADEAVAVVKGTHPKVVTLDLQIEGGGPEAIASIMRTQATPILVLSVAVQGAWQTRAVDALAAGAVDVLPKPVRWDEAAQAKLRNEVRRLAGIRIRPSAVIAASPPPPASAPSPRPERVVAIAASTGGPVAVANVLCKLEGIAAPVLVVQHLHPEFVAGFVAWLGRTTPLPVKTAVSGERLRPGVVYVAPGGVHLRVNGLCSAVLDPHPENAVHRPSGDELFRSLATAVGARAVGVLLTGMGTDGAAGLLAIRDAGGAVIVQDETTSAVYGMPRAALKLGAARQGLPLDEIGDAVMSAVRRPRRAGR